MSEDSSYPCIDPINFDLVIVGTGLSESVIAAAASAAGKTVLHLDHNSFYGSHCASLSLNELTSFLSSHSVPPQPPPSPSTTDEQQKDDHVVIDLIPRSLYSEVEISSYASETEAILLETSRKFNLDLGGPRALFCADKTIDLLLKSGASQYLEFKSIDASFIFHKNNENGNLVNVPDSRAAIFKDKSLGIFEKNKLMAFFKLVQQHLAASSSGNNGNDTETSESAKISDEDLDCPFHVYLKKIGLPPKIKSIILYAIAMADYDQYNNEACQEVLKTKDGIDRLALYISSVGRFPNASGALLYPIYGEGELPQAFCRRAAVKGCLYVLRMTVTSLLIDKDTGHYKGVRLASGQDLYSNQLILDPSFTVSPPSSAPIDFWGESLQMLSRRDVKEIVARGICVTRSSIKSDVSNCLVVYPPKSFFPEQVTSVRALQIGANLAVCPSGMFILYISTLCDDANQGKKLVHATMNALLTIPVSGIPESNPIVQTENADAKPTVLWSACYIQELTTGHYESISSTPMPDGNLTYNDLLEEAVRIFHQMYQNEEFFPETISPENPEDNGGLTLEI
ncbi:Rab proteins geranylgeranyltransferase component [Quillaja saponaria]|uniref:Rab escort protein 1 n=1 Tax=Quillaja saponaria TaxID=32244 RepID=A0AAD7PBY1_QUISA|nr:Rab proteins geranylgeranyltransferase component [Quillaja saponaria]